MNSSGSLYPTDQRYDPYYNNTKVILNFATLTNQAFTNRKNKNNTEIKMQQT
jgi:hypothetical protein